MADKNSKDPNPPSSVISSGLETTGPANPPPDPDMTGPAIPPPANEPTDLPPIDCIGEGLRYRILRPHAKGGLGEVFIAEDLELHRTIALKEIQKDHANEPQSRSRFEMEAKVTGGLEHPGVVPVYGLGHYKDGRPFYAMRLIRGETLKEAAQR